MSFSCITDAAICYHYKTMNEWRNFGINCFTGNYRSCVVSVAASTVTEPDNWVPLVTHTFMSHDEARAGKFRDQIEIFEKSQLDALKLHIKFDRVKVSCMQTANLRETFGLSLFVLKTESTRYQNENFVKRSKLLEAPAAEAVPAEFKEKFIKQLDTKVTPPYRQVLAQMISEERVNRLERCKEKLNAPMKLGFLDRLQDETEKNKIKIREERVDKERKVAEKEVEHKKKKKEEKGIPSCLTPKDLSPKDSGRKLAAADREMKNKEKDGPSVSDESKEKGLAIARKAATEQCLECKKASGNDTICNNCNKLHAQKVGPVANSKKKSPTKKRKRPAPKPKKPFARLFEDVSFSMSGYQNPHRDEIRRKALKMGAKYIADPNTTDNKCSHLICAFKNTPKSNLLKGHTKIVSHTFIEHSHDNKTRSVIENSVLRSSIYLLFLVLTFGL